MTGRPRADRRRPRLLEPEIPAGGSLARPSRRLFLGLGAVLAALVLYRVVVGGGAPADPRLVAVSCTSAAVGLSATTVPAGGSVQVEVTGPPRDTYVVWLDATSATDRPDGLSVPTPAGAAVLLDQSRLRTCRLAATITVPRDTAVGPHAVTVLRTTTGGQAFAASTPLTVTAPAG